MECTIERLLYVEDELCRKGEYELATTVCLARDYLMSLDKPGESAERYMRRREAEQRDTDKRLAMYGDRRMAFIKK